MAKQTTKQRLLKALKNSNLSIHQAQKRFGVKNVSARVSELRDDGHEIYTLVKHTKEGKKYVYSLTAKAGAIHAM